jgi:hypothetical protein
VIEYNYLCKIANESHFDIKRLKKQWGNYIIKQSNSVYILELTKSLEIPFFYENNYYHGATDFYGYEFSIDKEGRIIGISFYKP